MKRLYTALLYVAILLFSADGFISHAQLPTQGKWGKFANVVDAEGEIELTGDVEMVGVIRIPLGKTFKITSKKDVTIKNTGIGRFYADGDPANETTSGRSRMFTVKGQGGKLIIEAAEGCTITLDGGADFSWNNYALNPGVNTRSLSEAICNEGTLELKNVIIKNVNGSNQNGGAIMIDGSADGPTTLTNCKIENCYSQLGSAIMIQGSHPVRITDSEINYCISGGGNVDNSGGAIRTYGSVSASLYLTRVKFMYNYAKRNEGFNNTLVKDGNGGALFWNARGTNDTKCVIDGCEFAYNKSDDNGGAIKSQATVEFVNTVTKIHHNSAPIGGGMYIEGYTGGASVAGARTIKYDLNENMEVYANTSPGYFHEDIYYAGKGAGIHLYFGNQMKLEAGSTIQLEMNGAKIYDNSTDSESSNGGGIYFENTSLPEMNYTFDIKLSYGSVTGNIAGNGGGIYVSQGNVSSNTVEGKTLTVSDNTSGAGAGLYIKDGSLSMANGTISGNTVSGTGNGGGIYIENGNFEIDAGEVSGNTVASGQGAGVYIIGSEGKGNFTMNGGEIKGNTASGNNGGGVYINGGNFTLNSGTITNNNAVDGGGVYLNNGNFSLVTGKIGENTATRFGGGVYLIGDDCIYKLKNGAIETNTASNGGGVYLANGSFILAEDISDTGSISGNSASGNGGGVYIAGNGGFTMNGGTVEQNMSTGNNGGGIFLNGGNFTLNNGDIKANSSAAQGGGVYLYGGTFLMGNGTIEGNSSSTDGGGVCIVNNGSFTMNNGDITGNGKSTGTVVTQNGGGVYIDGGTLTVTSGNISSNASNVNGGGVYIMNGTVMMGAGKILANSCGQYGGGVYVYNSSTTDKKTVTFNGGTLSGNSAKYGGGVCVDGLIDMSIGNVEIAENTATNGGGVCLMNKAFMEFGVGEIKNNTAVKRTSTIYGTGYKKGISEVEGFGGGVYLDSNTTLVFGEAENLGLFGNLADYGGDEIFANGNGTYVDLPDVSQMALGGYPGASNLKWIEDYPTNDPDYGYGTKLKGDAWESDKTNLRYRETISQNAQIYNLTGAVTGDSRYICFALGYEVIYITIVRHGLGAGESAIYHLTKNEANDFKIILTGNSTGDPVTKKVAVTAGDWTVTETPWSWAYGTSGRTITRAVPDPDPETDPVTGKKVDRPFVFNISKTEILPMNSEDIELNIMGN